MNQLDAYQSALYPYENNYVESLDSLAQIETFVYVVKYEEGIVGCAILARPKTPYSEIKRVFCQPRLSRPRSCSTVNDRVAPSS